MYEESTPTGYTLFTSQKHYLLSLKTINLKFGFTHRMDALEPQIKILATVWEQVIANHVHCVYAVWVCVCVCVCVRVCVVLVKVAEGSSVQSVRPGSDQDLQSGFSVRASKADVWPWNSLQQSFCIRLNTRQQMPRFLSSATHGHQMWRGDPNTATLNTTKQM